MKVQELRIGNLVRFDGNNVKIQSIDLGGYIGLSDIIVFEQVHIDDLKPIEVTKESLIRFKNDSGDWFLGDEETDLQIKYIHQLQNLYFALTGKEL